MPITMPVNDGDQLSVTGAWTEVVGRGLAMRGIGGTESCRTSKGNMRDFMPCAIRGCKKGITQSNFCFKTCFYLLHGELYGAGVEKWSPDREFYSHQDESG